MQKNRLSRIVVRGMVLATCCSLLQGNMSVAQDTTKTQADNQPPITFPFREGDKVQWIGSSSTSIGIWPKTMEFLLRTRHPELKLTFKRSTTGGGTFVTGSENLDKWVDEYKPTLVLLNYGGNDAGAGEKGLPQFKANMEKLVTQVQAKGARVVLMTHQAGDVRKTQATPLANRKLYAETMLSYGRKKGWPIVDIYHPLEMLQAKAQADDAAFTINTDTIHLTHSAYIAWGYALYEGLNPPPVESSAAISASGQVLKTTNCKVSDVKVENQGLSFTRSDNVLPIFPPVLQNMPLPPRQHVPLEKLSRYMLQITGLPVGNYAVSCEGQPVGVTSAASLATGVNLNTLLLDLGNTAPWAALAREIWDAKSLDKIGQTQWRFQITKQ